MDEQDRENDPLIDDAASEAPGRRRFCQVVIGGMTTVTVGTVAFPGLTFLTLPRSNRPGEVMEVPVEDIQEGTPVWGEHEGRQIVLLRTNGEVRVFDGACTHLGCIVHWDSGAGAFKCPCHGATFDAAGSPTGGPVNVPLRSIPFTVKDGVLAVT